MTTTACDPRLLALERKVLVQPIVTFLEKFHPDRVKEVVA